MTALVLVTTLTVAVGAALYARHLENFIVARLTGQRWAIPSRIYSEPFVLFPGLDVRAAALFDRLRRLDYRSVAGPRLRKGDYHRTASAVDIFLHDFAYPGKRPSGQHLRLQLAGSTLVGLRNLESGKPLYAVQLEPELITGLYDHTWKERRVIKLDAVPALLVRAIVTTEDRRFFQHHGIDPIGILRALIANIRQGHVVQGGSTLTQQLMKNFFLSEEQTLHRKLREALMALLTERRFNKKQILEDYLNEIYLGQNGIQGIFGIWEASRYYFARPPEELSVAETAMLAGLIRAPNRYSPFRHPKRALARRNLVLRLMRDAGEITRSQYRKAVTERIRQARPHSRRNAAPYFVDFLRRELERNYPRDVLTSQGLRIFTGLDVQLQRFAEKAVSDGIASLERDYPKLHAANPARRLQAALIALQPQTGEIKAMVGGRDYASSQFNRAVDGYRQPGSVFKPFVYLAAFESSAHDKQPIEPTTILDDDLFDWHYDAKVWRPHNYRDHYFGKVTVRHALEYSLNAATARLAQRTGLASIVTLARRLGLGGRLPAYPAIVLGAADMSPLEVARAYTVFPNQGVLATPRAAKKVLDAGDRPIERRDVTIHRIVSPESAYLVTHLMEGVMTEGTGQGSREQGFTRPAAGKTGTTNNAHDAWFAGFTPDLLTVVWVGFDERRPLGLTGARAALPIWTKFMKAATAYVPATAFPTPPGIAMVAIDPYTGGVATARCPDSIDEAFRAGDEPKKPCPRHSGFQLPAWLSGARPTTNSIRPEAPR